VLFRSGIRTSMLIGALAYLAAAGLAWRCVPAKAGRSDEAREPPQS
jgi:DHA2 family methylenomycin A resistance protein-like MFS transporter